MSGAPTLRRPELVLVALGTSLGAAWLFLRFNANGVQSGDAWIAYLPGAIAAERLDLGLFRESLAFGYGRPVLPPLLMAAVHVASFGLTLPQASHLLTVLAGVAVSLLCYVLLRRSVSTPWAIAGTALVMCMPAVIRSWVYTTPDMVFTAFTLALVWAILTVRPKVAVLAFGAAALTRSNGLVLLPAVAAFLLLRGRSRGSRAAHVGAAIGLAGLANALTKWGKPRASLLGSPASQWHPSIFVDGSTGWSLEAKLDWGDPMQLPLLLYRAALTAPADVFTHGWRDGAFESLPHLVFLTACTIGLGLFLFRQWRGPRPRVTWVLLGGLLCLYVPMALFHWETRYMLAVYVGLAIVGFAAVARHLSDRPGWLVALLASGTAIWMFHALESEYPRRPSLGLDDSEYQLDLAQTMPAPAFERLAASIPRRPIRLQGCESMPFPYFNYVRFRDYPDLIQCTGWRFWNESKAEDVDAWIFSPKADYLRDPERTLRERVTFLFEVGSLSFGRIESSTTSTAAEDLPRFH